MSKDVFTIFGLRELPRPKGTGYLYVSYEGKSEGMPLAHFDFYKTSDDELRAIFARALPELSNSCSLQRYELVNFSSASEIIFREVASQLGLIGNKSGFLDLTL